MLLVTIKLCLNICVILQIDLYLTTLQVSDVSTHTVLLRLDKPNPSLVDNNAFRHFCIHCLTTDLGTLYKYQSYHIDKQVICL